jgi:hypothetical protein
LHILLHFLVDFPPNRGETSPVCRKFSGLDSDGEASGNVAESIGGFMSNPLEDRLASLPKLSMGALSELWQELFNKPAPSPFRRNFITPILAYKLQEQALGTVGPKRDAAYRKLSSLLENRSSRAATLPVIKPGTRLVREWRGQVHLVEASEQGYEYKGKRFASLSEIARQITGARWSGPLFFGLKSKSNTNAGVNQ